MKSLYSINKNHVSAQSRYRKRQSELRKQQEEIEEQLKALKYPHFLDYLKQLGKAALPLIPGAVSFDTYGPFGLGSEVSIYFHGKPKKGEKEGKTLAGATFTSGGTEGYRLKDYSKNSGRFAEGTIGEMNGMNYGSIPITEEMTLEWFVKFACKSYNR